MSKNPNASATGPRQYELVRKVRESEVISSFYLRPVSQEPLAVFRPGQFLTLDLVASSGIALRRTYSLSCGPAVKDCYRISVKRETHGAGSRVLHDEIEVGARLTIHNPKGDFVLNQDSDRPVVLLSGGVGLTPMISMLHALAEEDRRDVFFIHACDSGGVHALDDEVRELVERSDRIRQHICYRKPGSGDVLGRNFDSEGFVSKQLLQQLLPVDDYEVYLCGPPIFMQLMYELLCELGVAEERIAYEFFGDSVPLRRSSTGQSTDNEPMQNDATDEPLPISGDAPLVTFSSSGIQVPWMGNHESLLELAEASGLSPEFSCRAGICNTCECSIGSGDVNYFDEPLSRPEAGRVLICCSIPDGDITLDL
ncbi:MAG: 2Fe-2S iron-sulfur cluster-binding protein [Proteobacteria bacterium]|nr:2Fe-2S iron-sulfur cluster-binding protein [Pseudomonadota bacterium]